MANGQRIKFSPLPSIPSHKTLRADVGAFTLPQGHVKFSTLPSIPSHRVDVGSKTSIQGASRRAGGSIATRNPIHGDGKGLCSASSRPIIPNPGAPRFHLRGYAGCVPPRLGGMVVLEVPAQEKTQKGFRNSHSPYAPQILVPERPRDSVAGHVFSFSCFMGVSRRSIS